MLFDPHLAFECVCIIQGKNLPTVFPVLKACLCGDSVEMSSALLQTQLVSVLVLPQACRKTAPRGSVLYHTMGA